jgi:hypothetical protein
MAHGHVQLNSTGQFYLGLLLIGLAIAAVIAEYPDVRYDIAGLQEVRGRVVGIESVRKRMQGHTLEVALATANGVVQLKQNSVGASYSGRIAPGQDIRAWVSPRDSGANGPPTYPVWQIERGGRVVMPALDVGDQVLDGYKTLCGGLLIALLGGGYLVARHLMRHPPSDDGQA